MRVTRYRVHPDRADEDQRLVEDVFRELADAEPAPAVRYTSVRLEDGTFIHTVDGDDGALPQLGAFQRFIADLGERCAEAPVRSSAAVVGDHPAPGAR